ncbi:MAG: MoaD/ThiS family protein [Candidatus Villigracilaceae bacterium]
MPVLRLPTPMRSYTNGQAEVQVNGQTVAEAMRSLITQFPAMQPHLYNERGELRPFVNLFIGATNIRDLQGLETVVAPDETILLIPSIAGG